MKIVAAENRLVSRSRPHPPLQPAHCGATLGELGISVFRQPDKRVCTSPEKLGCSGRGSISHAGIGGRADGEAGEGVAQPVQLSASASSIGAKASFAGLSLFACIFGFLLRLLGASLFQFSGLGLGLGARR
jgi:hypothetical protein